MKITIELAAPMEAYLDDLADTGLYGSSPEEVAADLVRTGVISAISSKVIYVRRDGKHDRPAPIAEIDRNAPVVSARVPKSTSRYLEVPSTPAEASTLPAITPTQARALEAVKELLSEDAYFSIRQLNERGGPSAGTCLTTLKNKGYLRQVGERGAPLWEIAYTGEPKIEQWVAGRQNVACKVETKAKPAPKRRFTEHKELTPETVGGLPADHPAIIEARTLFPSTVFEPSESPRLLVSGQHSRKLGSHVTKGPWNGFPIYQLTLEERATCPTTCAHWTSCYGNGMPQSRRHAHGPDLIDFLRGELTDLQEEHPKGFVVRLHVLGDFWSVDYVAAWFGFIRQFPALHIFGYTAWPRSSEIGGAIKRITDRHWDRFAIRFSDAEAKPQGATTIWRQPEADKVPEGLVCPAQTGKTDCCGSCGLCWSETMRNQTIVFVAHGPKFNGGKQGAVIVGAEPVQPVEIREEPVAPVAPKPLSVIEKIKAAAEKQTTKNPRLVMADYLQTKQVRVAVIGRNKYEARGQMMDLDGLVQMTNKLRAEDGLDPIVLEEA